MSSSITLPVAELPAYQAKVYAPVPPAIAPVASAVPFSDPAVQIVLAVIVILPEVMTGMSVRSSVKVISAVASQPVSLLITSTV